MVILSSSILMFQSPTITDTNSSDILQPVPTPVEETQEIETAQYSYDHLVPTRDVSIPEIEADRIWAMMDTLGLNITGE